MFNMEIGIFWIILLTVPSINDTLSWWTYQGPVLSLLRSEGLDEEKKTLPPPPLNGVSKSPYVIPIKGITFQKN